MKKHKVVSHDSDLTKKWMHMECDKERDKRNVEKINRWMKWKEKHKDVEIESSEAVRASRRDRTPAC